jgi:hypothetical protein
MTSPVHPRRSWAPPQDSPHRGRGPSQPLSRSSPSLLSEGATGRTNNGEMQVGGRLQREEIVPGRSIHFRRSLASSCCC